MPPAPSTIAVTTIVEFVRDFTPDAKSAKPQARAAPRARTISTAGSVGQGVRRPYDAAVEVPRTTEIAVIGAGAIGASAALQLALAGREVLLLDRGAVGQGASAGTACLITPSHAERLANPRGAEGGDPVPARPGRAALDPAATSACCRGWRASRRRPCGAAPRTPAPTCCGRASIESVALHREWAASAPDGPRRERRAERLGDRGGRRAPPPLGRRAPRGRHRGAAARRRRGARAGAARPRGAVRLAVPRRRARRLAGVRAGRGRAPPRRPAPGSSPASTRCGSTPGPSGRPARHHRRADPGLAGRRRRRRLVVAPGPRRRRDAADVAGEGLPRGVRRRRPAPQRPIFLGESRVVATPLAGRVRLAGTLEFGADPDAVDYRRVDAITRAGASGWTASPARRPAPSGAGRGRSRPTACRWSAARRATSASSSPPATPCSAS